MNESTQSQLEAPVLPREFYRECTVSVARGLLGSILVSELNSVTTAGIIVEVEAYLGQNDTASHAANGPTPRTQIQWGPPGHAYVYLIYGMYSCLNFVTEPEGSPGCVLIRALQPVHGTSTMHTRRNRPRKIQDLTNGPGKLTQALGIQTTHNGSDLTTSPLSVRQGSSISSEQIGISTRIGINVAEELPLRFFVKDNSYVSRHPKINVK